MPFALASDHPPTFFPFTDLESATQLSLATRPSQDHFLRFTPYYPSTMWAPRFVTIIPSRWRPLSTSWSTGVCRPRLLPLSRGCGTLFSAYWLSRSTRVLASLENAKPVWWPLPVPGRAEAISREVGKAHDAYGEGYVHGEEPEPGLCWPSRPGLCLEEPACGFRESRFLERQVKLIKKMATTWLTSVGRLVPRQGWASISLEGLPSSLPSTVAFEEPLWFPRFCLKPLSAATRQLFNHPGALSQALDQV